MLLFGNGSSSGFIPLGPAACRDGLAQWTLICLRQEHKTDLTSITTVMYDRSPEVRGCIV